MDNTQRLLGINSGSISNAWDTHPLNELPPFKWLLPDGTTLEASENSHLARTVRIILYTHCRRELDPNTVTGGVDSLCRVYGQLVHWMKLRGIQYFKLLCLDDLKQYITDSAAGYDHLLQVTPRVSNYLLSLPANSAKESFKTVMLRVGLPPEHTRLVKATAVYKEYWRTGKIRNTEPERKDITLSHLSRISNALSLLHRYDNSLEDCLTFSPDANGDLHSQVRKIGRPNGSTRTIPHQLSVRLISSSIHWLVELAPHLLDVLQESSEEAGKSHAESIQISHKRVDRLNHLSEERGWNITFVSGGKNSRGTTRLSIAANNHLRTACLIVILVFSGRRSAEILKLSCDPLLGSAEAGFWIEGPIGKRSMNDATPCPPLVAVAIDTLIELAGTEAPDADERPLLTLPRRDARRKSDKPIPYHRNMLSAFAELEGLASIDGSEPWVYAYHQFRRLFALTYFWRYDDPSLVALAYHFRHMNMKMIRSYVRDSEFMKLMAMEGERFTATKLRHIADGEKSYGVFGKFLARAIDRLRRTVEVSDAQSLSKRIDSFIKERGLILSPTPWGFCSAKSSSSNIRRASCQQDGKWKRLEYFSGRPDADASSEELCAKCHFHSTDDSRKSHWLNQISDLKASIAAAPTKSLIVEALESRLKTIESFAKNSFLSAPAV